MGELSSGDGDLVGNGFGVREGLDVFVVSSVVFSNPLNMISLTRSIRSEDALIITSLPQVDLLHAIERLHERTPELMS